MKPNQIKTLVVGDLKRVSISLEKSANDFLATALDETIDPARAGEIAAISDRINEIRADVEDILRTIKDGN